MSSLTVAPLELSDFDTLETFSAANGGDCAPPVLPFTWPTSTDAEATARNKWSIAQQREMFLCDPTARFVKAVLLHDEKTEAEIVSLARWHFYPTGFKYSEHMALELDALAPPDSPPTWPEGLNGRLHAGMLKHIFGTREEWTGTGPMWVLTTLVTRNAYRKRGAAGKLIAWGTEQAKRDGVPAFVEAVPSTSSLYLKLGWQRIATVETDCAPFGLDLKLPLDRLALRPGDRSA